LNPPQPEVAATPNRPPSPQPDERFTPVDPNAPGATANAPLHEAVRAAQETAQQEQPVQKSSKKKNQKKAPAMASQNTPAFQRLEGPPPPVSADKQQKLANLLRRYQADEVTPAEYQQERAKILAEP
jgi:hypothetical protein